MNAKFYLLHLRPKAGIQVGDDRIVKQLNRAMNWIGIPPYTWILYSTSSPEQWYQRIRSTSSQEETSSCANWI